MYRNVLDSEFGLLGRPLRGSKLYRFSSPLCYGNMCKIVVQACISAGNTCLNTPGASNKANTQGGNLYQTGTNIVVHYVINHCCDIGYGWIAVNNTGSVYDCMRHSIRAYHAAIHKIKKQKMILFNRKLLRIAMVDLLNHSGNALAA